LSVRAPSGTPDLTVDCNGGGDHTTISAAIDAAPERGWIEVLPCTYAETLDLRGKTLWISSTAGPAATVIDANGAGSAVVAEDGEGDRTAIVGFTIDDADSPAVDVELSALRLQDVVITDTNGLYAVRSLSGDLELANVVIDGSNDSSAEVVFADKGSVVIRGGRFTCGSGDGLFLGHGAFHVDSTDVSCPNDVAVEIEHSIGRIQRTVLTGDLDVLTEEDHDEDLIRLEDVTLQGDAEVEFGTFTFLNSVTTGTLTFVDTAPTVTIENSVFTGGGCALDTALPLGPVRYNDFSGGPSTCGTVDYVGVDGNFAANPLFVDPR
jgi:hypothetical protein